MRRSDIYRLVRGMTAFLPFCLLTLLPFPAAGQDYVDVINTMSGGRAAGHQVIYEMNVGSFTESGTFAAAGQRLGELKSLGIDIVWLMPIYPRGGGINSPYAATNFRQTNPAYGTIADLRAFVGAAHGLSMQVWLDWVPNHTATDADWVTTHPEYYKKSGGSFVHPNNYGDVYQLDYGNASLQEAMNDCLKFWIDEADIDGYRCDYISSNDIPTSYWQSAIPEIKNYKSGKVISFLGEADIAQDVTRLKAVGFDYDYAWAYQSSLVSYGGAGVYAAPLKANADKLLNASSGVSFGRMLYLTNHDQNWNEGKKTLAEKYGSNRYPLTVLAYTLYGMPLIYNGQETGGGQALNYFQDTKIDWSSRDDKMLNTLRTLTALKHAVAALGDKTGVKWTTSPLSSSPEGEGQQTTSSSVLAFTRKSGDSEVLVVLNMSNSNVSATLTGLTAGPWSLWLNSETIAQGVSRKQLYLSTTQTFSLEPKGYRVYVRGTFPEEDLPVPEVYVPTLEGSDEISLFFETPSADSYAVWVWGDLGGGEAYCSNTSWPGDVMTLMGQTSSGRYVYKRTLTKASEAPQYLIISKGGGATKIYDGVAFVNHGYYVEGQDTPTQVITDNGQQTTSSVPPRGETHAQKASPRGGLEGVYDLWGRRTDWPPSNSPSPLLASPDRGGMGGGLGRGIYIRNGKKFVVGRQR